jgi:hypothetical protein
VNLCGAPSNPWGYNFCGGGFIYAVPLSFCAYFNCIPSFWESTNGYAEQCVDGTYSHSGGRGGGMLVPRLRAATVVYLTPNLDELGRTDGRGRRELEGPRAGHLDVMVIEPVPMTDALADRVRDTRKA